MRVPKNKARRFSREDVKQTYCNIFAELGLNEEEAYKLFSTTAPMQFRINATVGMKTEGAFRSTFNSVWKKMQI